MYVLVGFVFLSDDIGERIIVGLIKVYVIVFYDNKSHVLRFTCALSPKGST